MSDPSNASLNQLLRWLILTLLFPLVCLNAWLSFKVLEFFEPLVTALTLAVLLSFLLGYPVQFLQQRGLKRPLAASLVFLTGFLLLAGLAVTLIPVLAEDAREMTQLLPQWFESGSQQLAAFQDWATSRHLPVNIDRLIRQLSNRFPDQLQVLADDALGLVLGVIDSVSEALLTAVLTFYLLLDGDRIADSLFRRLPNDWGGRIKRALQENFQNYFIGQVTLGALVGTTLTIAFLILHVPYALLFGLGVGVLALIPFGDTVSFTLISFLLAAQNVWFGLRVLVVAVVLDQLIDQLVAPRLLGRFTGLKPLWVLIALLAGAKIGGLLGLLLAVPLTSFLKTLLAEWEKAKAAARDRTALVLPAVQGDAPELMDAVGQ